MNITWQNPLEQLNCYQYVKDTKNILSCWLWVMPELFQTSVEMVYII